jgi:hypothetical protein
MLLCGKPWDTPTLAHPSLGGGEAEILKRFFVAPLPQSSHANKKNEAMPTKHKLMNKKY